MSKSTRTRPRKELSKAEIKAYEARRAAEAQRRVIVTPEAEVKDDAAVVSSQSHAFAASRAEELATIRSDLRRLLMIVAVLAVILVAMTFILG